MNETQLLQDVHEATEMGISGLSAIIPHTKDDALLHALKQQTAEYKTLSEKSGTLLRAQNQNPKNPNIMAKLSAEVMSTAKTLVDSSASKIAEMVIQGNTMGITAITRNLNAYDGGDAQIRGLAETLLKTQQANVEQMKHFL